MSAPYSPADDSRRGYDLWVRTKRERLIRLGTLPPETDQEKRWAEEGEVPPSRLDTAREPDSDEELLYVIDHPLGWNEAKAIREDARRVADESGEPELRQMADALEKIQEPPA